jgi:hypothetical protein
VLPIGFLVILLNYYIDPANIFSSEKYTKGIAAIILKGHNVENISNYDERMLQKQVLNKITKAPDVVVLGSSRVMEIGSDFFPGKLVLNCGVSHGNIHDLIAITGLMDSLHKLPGLLIINVDPWLIGKGTLEWQTLSEYHNYMLKRITADNEAGNTNYQSNNLRKFYSLISFDYFKKSVDFIRKGVSKKYSDVGTFRPLYGRFSDGTICYSEKVRHPDSLKVATDAKETAIKEGIPKPDQESVLLLERMLDFLQSKNIKIEMLMLPVHPAFYREANKNNDNFNSTESLFKEIAKKKGIPVIGSFNAQTYELTGSEFYDMYHCSKDAIKKIMN